MKIKSKVKNSQFDRIYNFENKRELIDFAKKRIENTGDILTNLKRRPIWEILDFCNLERIKK